MATFGDMKTRIANEISRSDLTTYISDAIKSAVAFYAVERFDGNEKRGTITTIAGTRLYDTSTASPGTLPSDIEEIDSIVCTVSGRDFLLKPRSYAELEDIDPGTTLTTGDPRCWAWYASKLRLYPTPNDARVLTISYQYTLTALSSDNDTNFWTNEGEELIRARAKKNLALHKMRNPQMAQDMAAVEREAYSQLKRRAGKMIGSGRIKGTAF